MGLAPDDDEILGGTAGYTVVDVKGGAANTVIATDAATLSAAVLNNSGRYLRVFMVNSKGETKTTNPCKDCTPQEAEGLTILKYDCIMTSAFEDGPNPRAVIRNR